LGGQWAAIRSSWIAAKTTYVGHEAVSERLKMFEAFYEKCGYACMASRGKFCKLIHVPTGSSIRNIRWCGIWPTPLALPKP